MPRLTFNQYGHLSGQLPNECVTDCSHSGACDSDVEYWVNKLHFTEAIEAVRELAVRHLREYGAWDDLDTADTETLAQRILWIAAGDVKESGEPWYGLGH